MGFSIIYGLVAKLARSIVALISAPSSSISPLT
jgi:hypothetical protein